MLEVCGKCFRAMKSGSENRKEKKKGRSSRCGERASGPGDQVEVSDTERKREGARGSSLPGAKRAKRLGRHPTSCRSLASARPV